MVCHEGVLLAARKIVSAKSDNHFTMVEIQVQMLKDGIEYTPKTINTHVSSRCCANATSHHGTTYNYFERVSRGVYKIKEDHLE